MFAVLATAAFASHAQTCLPLTKQTDWTSWLESQEQAGGHTKACHLGVDDSGLIGRISNRGIKQDAKCNSPGDGVASAWSDPASMKQAIQAAIAHDAATIANGPAGTHVLEGRAGANIGRRVSAYTANTDLTKNSKPCSTNRGYVCEKTNGWKAIVRKDANGSCFLLTAYPV